MATYRRLTHPGATWFFTLATERRRPLLTRPDILRAIAYAANEVERRYAFEILAWTVLPDHLHAIARLPAGDAAYARRISIFKRLVSQRVAPAIGMPRRTSVRKRQEYGLWQRRFWEHMIRNDDDFHRHLDYIHYNPVKHGHVRSALAWPYSSSHRYVRLGVLPADWAGMVESPPGAGFGE